MMHQFKKYFAALLQPSPWLASTAVLLVGLAISATLWRHSQQQQIDRLHTEFEFVADQAANNIRARFNTYEIVMRGVKGYFDGSENVTIDEFRTYVQALRIQKKKSGVQGIGLVMIVPHADKGRHIAELRKQGLSDYQIKPEGIRDHYTPIVRMEPMVGDNLKALGFDTLTVPAARAAMEQSLNSGDVVITSPITLVQDAGKPSSSAFVMYLPIFHKGANPDTLTGRRAAIVGWVDVPFRINDLMAGLHGEFAQDIDLEIHDGKVLSDKTRMYHSDERSSESRLAEGMLLTKRQLDVGGRSWTLLVNTTPAFEARVSNPYQPVIIAWAGVALSLTLSWLAWLLAKGRQKAQTRYKKLFAQAGDGVLVLTRDHRFVDANAAALQLLGYTREELFKLRLPEILAKHELTRLDPGVSKMMGGIQYLEEWVHVRKDGTEFTAEVSASRLDGESYFAILRDLTERKKAEQHIQRLSKLYQALSETNQAIVRMDNEVDLFPLVCQYAVQFGDMKMAWIGLIDEASQQVNPVASYGDDSGYLTDIHISVDAANPMGQGPTGTSIRENRPFWCQDFINNPLTAAWHERGAIAGWAASASLPLHRNGVAIGAFTLYASEVNAFDEEIRQLLVEMATDISFALDNFDREAQRQISEKALAESEARMAVILGNVGAYIYLKDCEGRYLFANQQVLNMWEGELEDILGFGDEKFFDAQTAEKIRENDRRVLVEGETIRQEETNTVPKTGKTATYWSVKLPLRRADGSIYALCGISTDITERKLMEDKLRLAQTALEESRDRYADLYEFAPVGYLSINEHGMVVEVNWKVTAMFGLKRQQLIQHRFAEFIADDDKGRWQRQFAHIKALSGGEELSFDMKFVHENGSIFDASLNLLRMDDADDQPILRVTLVDVTKLKQAEEEKRQSDISLHATLEAIPDLLFELGLNGRYYAVHSPQNNLLATPPEKLIGGTVHEMLPPDAAAIVLSSLREANETGSSQGRQFELKMPEGDRWFELSVAKKPTNDEQNPRFVVLLRDITGRKQVEAALQSSESHLRTIIDIEPECIKIVDAQGHLMEMNPAGLAMIEADSLEQVVGHPLINLVAPEYHTAFDRLHKRVLAGESGQLEFEVIGLKGGHRWLETHAVPMLENGKKVLLGVTRDITQRKLAELDLRIAAIAFESQEGMMVTDANKVILKVNKAFSAITGYTVEEAIGLTPRLLSSGHHKAGFYDEMWDSIKNTGSWAGEVWNRRKNGEVYPQYITITAVKSAGGIITNYVATFTDVTLRRQAEAEIHQLAFYDPLTNLPNRRLLLDHLNHAMAASARLGWTGALLYLDLDHFKVINDTRGHDIGDLLLQQIAGRLTSSVREGDTVARLGGDEFVVMLEELSVHVIEAAAQAEAVANKIRIALSQPYQLATHEYRSTTSIGVALFIGHNQSQEDLLKHADIALYQAKTAGRNTIRFFDPLMQDAINTRVLLENELHKALDQQQFRLYYQIQVNSSEHPIGAEALIRWLYPERGLISPFHFIPLAEETWLILPIGQWVLDTACAQLKTWEKDSRTRNLSISVNVSAKQLRQVDFVAQVQAAVRTHAINPMLLKLELTESILANNIEQIIITMIALQAIGVRFELDDFGTGYSSLQYLKQLPLYQLKIDQSFVREIATDSSDQAIIRTIIAMAESLNLDVIAEGVESEEQRELLMRSGCTHYQGYLFGKPVPIEQFDAALKKG